MGAGLLCTEMVSAKGMYYNSPNTGPLLAKEEKERPIAAQIFGSDPELMADMAVRIEDMGLTSLSSTWAVRSKDRQQWRRVSFNEKS